MQNIFRFLLSLAGIFLFSVVPLRSAITAPVNLFMGTSGDHGQVTPAAAVPFSMVAVGPDSKPRQHGGYDYDVVLASGISVNRLSGVGGSGCGGNLSIRPAAFDVPLNRIPAMEHAVPGFYTVQFDNGSTAELTAAQRMAVERYTFSESSGRSLYIDIASGFTSTDAACHIQSNRVLTGIVRAKNTCSRGRYQLAFCLKTSSPFTARRIDSHRFQLVFQESQVEVRVGLSSVSPSDAEAEVEALSTHSFEDIKEKAENKWNALLNKIEVTGATADERAVFYTSLYRACLSPHEVAPRGKCYRGTDGNLHLADSHTYYSSWSMWDTYRCKFTLLTFLAPDVMQDAANSLIDLFMQGKAAWSTDFEPTPTVRTEHSAVILLDCYRRGLAQMELSKAWSGIKKEIEELPLSSPDQCIEAVSDYWAAAQIASILNKPDEAEQYDEEGEKLFEQTWKKEFMNITPDFTKMKNNGLYQGTRWQYRWAAPFYMDKMEAWVGREELVRQLSEFFDRGLFNQGNEPDIHTPFIFDLLGEPQLTQRIVTRLLSDSQMVHRYGGNAEFPTPYVGRAFRNSTDGYMPEMDEDDGTMSAWYAFAAMGFYPLVVGSDEFVLSSPLFDRTVIHLTDGKTFTIVTKGRRKPGALVRKVLLNGKRLPDFRLRHADLVAGGRLEFVY